ncbi:MAG: hypothetical protein JNM98_21000 [Rhodocyclaceae bacterium]|nr:hypothetical protein [Rhodocyclaceae bacterium]
MRICLALLLLPLAAWAGGSNYGVEPGGRAQIAGRVTEWPVPTPKFARDPAPAPDGSIFITVMSGDKIARFDPATQSFREWNLPAGAHPHGLVVDPEGAVWYTGNGNGTIGRLDPQSGKIQEYAVPGGGDPHTIMLDAVGTLWFTVQHGQRMGRLERSSGAIQVWQTSGNPYGIAVDAAGKIWFCRIGDDRVGWLDPATGKMDEIDTGRGSRPRRMAVARDGSLWVTAYGDGRLLRIDTRTARLQKAYAMPGGAGSGPYAVTMDAAGRVWVDEINTDTVAIFDPASERFRALRLPTANTGIRKAIIAADGRYWYMGSHSGKLGVIE